jgi:hypothetical protein
LDWERELGWGDNYVPTELRVVRAAERRAPKIIEALAGTGLLRYAGAVPQHNLLWLDGVARR